MRAGNAIQRRERLAGKFMAAPATFSRRCSTDEVPGISRMFGERCSSQASATAIGVASRRIATDFRTSDCSGVKPPRGKYGTYAIPWAASELDYVVVVPVGNIVKVLHADDWSDGLRLVDLLLRYRAQAEMSDQPFPLQLYERAKRFGYRSRLCGRKPTYAQVDHIERVEAEAFEVVVHGLAQLLRSARCGPSALRISQRSYFRYDVKVFGIWVECLANNLVGDVRPVIVARVDVGDAETYRFTQHAHRGISVARRPEHVRTRQLHCTVAHAGDRKIFRQRERSAGEWLDYQKSHPWLRDRPRA